MRGMDEQQTGQPMTLRQWRDRRALGTAELAAIAGDSKVTVIAIEHGRVTAIKRRTMRRVPYGPSSPVVQAMRLFPRWRPRLRLPRAAPGSGIVVACEGERCMGGWRTSPDWSIGSCARKVSRVPAARTHSAQV